MRNVWDNFISISYSNTEGVVNQLLSKDNSNLISSESNSQLVSEDSDLNRSMI